LKVSVSDLSPCKKVIKIQIPQDVVNKELDEVYKEISKAAEIPGFRKGKAPRNVIEQHHSKAARDEVLNRLIPRTYSEAVKEHNIDPVAYPQVSGVKFIDNQPLCYEATVDVKPQIKLKKYKGLKAEKRKLKVDDSEIEDTLNSIKERFAEYKTIDDRAAKEGDFVVADYEFEAEGETEKRDNAWFSISNNANEIKEITEKLKGVKPNDELEVKAKLPDNYPKKEFASKEANFTIKVKEIKEKKLPELDEQFIKGLGDYKSVDEFMEALKKDVTQRKESEIKVELERQIIEQLIKFNPLTVPESMIEQQSEQLVKDLKMRLAYQGMPQEMIDKQEETLRKNAAKDAENQVKVFFLTDEIAKTENIEASDEDLKNRLELLAKQNKTDVKQIKEYLQKNNSIENLKDQIKREKVLGYLISEAKIKEVSK
jgi:trigger factor